MKIYFYTQDYENYGSPEKPYWKAKGGSDYILEAHEWTEDMIDKVYSLITERGKMLMSDVIGHLVVNDKFLTDCEQLQLEYEGSIEFTAVRVTYKEFLTKFEEFV